MAKYIPSEDWREDEICDMIIFENYDLTLKDELD